MMNNNQIYVLSQITCAMIEAMGMQAENNQHIECQPYSKQDFDKLIDRYGIGHNDILTALQEG